MLNAEGLAKIMNDLFDGVLYAGEYKRLNTAAMGGLLTFQRDTLPLS
jgi:hypothetical protein